MCVPASQAAMHSGMSRPVAPISTPDDPPLVAMTSPCVPTITAVGGSIAALTGPSGTAPLVAAFGKIILPVLRTDVPSGVVVALSVVVGELTAGTADSGLLAPRSCDPLKVTEVMSVVVGGLIAGVAKSCAPVLN